MPSSICAKLSARMVCVVTLDLVKKRRLMLVLTGVTVLLAGMFTIVLVLLDDHDPVLEGKRLSEWLGLRDTGDSVVRGRADQIVQQLGTNAVPLLLDWIQCEDLEWKRTANRYFSKLPRVLQPNFIAVRLRPVSEKQHHMALVGFMILDKRGANAVPELSRLMRTSSRPGQSILAVQCLYELGESGAPELRAALNGLDPELRVRVTNSLAQISPRDWQRITSTSPTPTSEHPR